MDILELMKIENIEVGKAVQLYERKFGYKRNCIITYVDKEEIILAYYDKNLSDITYKTISKEDLIFNDYKLKLLS